MHCGYCEVLKISRLIDTDLLMDNLGFMDTEEKIEELEETEK